MAYGILGGVVEYAYPGDVQTFSTDSSASTTIVGGNMVALADNFTVEQAGAKSVKSVGVALHTAAPGEKVTVARVGVYFLEAAGSINAGNLVETAAAGKVAVHTAAATTYPYVVGIALEDIGSGDFGRVALRLG